VTTVIPGARTADQAIANAGAAEVSLNGDFDEGVRWIYDHYFREAIHPRW
jgi:aryl-alcohol dehydrogenase-like predicted oxidoreductase